MSQSATPGDSLSLGLVVPTPEIGHHILLKDRGLEHVAFEVWMAMTPANYPGVNQ